MSVIASNNGLDSAFRINASLQSTIIEETTIKGETDVDPAIISETEPEKEAVTDTDVEIES